MRRPWRRALACFPAGGWSAITLRAPMRKKVRERFRRNFVAGREVIS